MSSTRRSEHRAARDGGRGVRTTEPTVVQGSDSGPEKAMATATRQLKPSRGRCEFCGTSAAKGEMRRHLEACAARAPVQALYLTVEGREFPDYWLHLEAAPNATLADLDRFLRRIWLECCGHLS